ncbi:MAG: protein N-lysine methyltransferase family protein [Desulfobacterales bacterium]|nr:protein N-lysine methyltransferase family protein [Desulfobacterales bacterium]
MFSIEAFYQEYETESTELVVNAKKFNILLPRYLDGFINPMDVIDDFPLWAKIWKASWVLSGYLADMPVEPDKRFLEIGAGVGLVSIVAASFGHQITMTEYNPDALNFAHANAHLNNCPGLPIRKLDWHRPQLSGKFDTIVASEVTYKLEDFVPLMRLFRAYLQPEGEIILASEMRKTGKDLFNQLKADFDIKVEKKSLRSETGATRIVLFKMRFHNLHSGENYSIIK